MLFNVILNIILIPKFSYLGTSLITVLTELLLFLFCFHFISKSICEIKKIPLIKPVIASGIMGIFLLLFDLNLFISLLISVLIYLAVLIALNTFSKEDIELFKEMIPFKKT
jgi:O-antigen/teichoic acid export membrane protein